VSRDREQPLAGRRIVVTRPEKGAGTLSKALADLGASVVLAPAIRFDPPADVLPLDEAIGRIATYDYVVFTSANAVDAFFDRYEEVRRRIFPSATRFVAVGPKTAASVRERGFEADVVPVRHTAEALGEALLARENVAGKRFLFPRADIARETLPELLKESGAAVDSVVAYRTVPATEALGRAVALVRAGEVDAVTFTSESTVRSFLDALGDRSLFRRFAAASIGPVTSRALRDRGIEPAVEAESSTAEGLVEAIARHFSET
jgi:uroporphyrinogen III methyltransferase/synthase